MSTSFSGTTDMESHKSQKILEFVHIYSDDLEIILFSSDNLLADDFCQTFGPVGW